MYNFFHFQIIEAQVHENFHIKEDLRIGWGSPLH